MYCCCCAAGFYSCLLMCICISVRVHVYVCVYIKQRIHKICVCADAAALAWLPWPGLVSDFVPRPLSLLLSLPLPSCRFSSLSSLLSHKLCLILPSPSLLLLHFLSLPSTFATRSCASNFALGTLALSLSRLSATATFTATAAPILMRCSLSLLLQLLLLQAALLHLVFIFQCLLHKFQAPFVPVL